MENRNGLVVDACLTRVDGHAERVAALHMIEPRADRPRRITLETNNGYDVEDFVDELRSDTVAPNVAAKTNGPCKRIDDLLRLRTVISASKRPFSSCCEVAHLVTHRLLDAES